MMRGLAIVLVVALGCGGKKPPVDTTPKPNPDTERAKQLETELAQAKEDLKKEKEAAEELRKSSTSKDDENKALQDKLAEAVGQSGEVTTADGAVKLQLVDQILFATGEADLTEKGREVLAKVGAALKEVDKQVWVQGHTDDQPIFIKKPKAEPPKKVDPKAKKVDPKAKKPEKPAGEGMVLAYMTNWELSAARALTVVHYLQDEAKIDPTRLAAVAFGQYRPVSRGNKALNRRIEIVLVPKKAVIEKEAPPKK
jgi:flagellar motor protein MotB